LKFREERNVKFFGKRRSKRAIFSTLTLVIVGLAATVAFAGSAGHYSWYPYGGHGNHYKPSRYYKPIVIKPITITKTNKAEMNQVINASNNVINDIQGNNIGGGGFGYYGSHYQHGHPYGHGFTFPYGGGYDNDAVDIENISQSINIMVNGNIDQDN
jgi:hypothetical protein